MITRCDSCGGIHKTDEVLRLDSFPGREHVKRAIEVAAVGDHAIVIETRRQHRPIAEKYAQIARNTFNISDISIIEPCYCGFLGDPSRQCTCTPAMITRWQRRKDITSARMNASIFIDFADVSFEKMTAKYKGEPDERIAARIAEARNNLTPGTDPSGLESTAARLLQAAMRQLALSEFQLASTLAVAGSVARLASESTIRAFALAEALQYRPRY